jgi:hypothetical protein
MTGRNNFMSKAFDVFMNMDKMVGADFEKGLEALDTATVALISAPPEPVDEPEGTPEADAPEAEPGTETPVGAEPRQDATAVPDTDVDSSPPR